MTEQEKREKVIRGLECIVSSGNAGMRDDCAKCIYPGGGDCLAPALRDALALLKAQEPRVMTLEEMQKIASIRDGAMWLEAGAGLMPAFMEFAARNITFFVAIPLTSYRQFFENDWYGKTWRCWTSRPTDEVRRATPWN